MTRLILQWYQIEAYFIKRADRYHNRFIKFGIIAECHKNLGRARKRVDIPKEYCSRPHTEVPQHILRRIQGEFDVTPEMILKDIDPS